MVNIALKRAYCKSLGISWDIQKVSKYLTTRVVRIQIQVLA
jgi:hypothetical protein